MPLQSFHDELYDIANRKPHLVIAALMAIVVLFSAALDKYADSFLIPIAALIGFAVLFGIMVRPAFGLILITFLIPFEYFQVIPGVDLTFSKIVGVLTFVSFGFNFLIGRIPGIPRSPVDLPLFLFILACLPGVLLSENIPDSFSRYVSLVSYLMLFYLCGSLIQTRRLLVALLITFWLSVFMVSLLVLGMDMGLVRFGKMGVIFTFIGNQLIARSAGSSANPAVFVMYPMYAFGVALALFHIVPSRVFRILLVVSLLIFVQRVYISYTRSAYLSIAVMSFVYYLMFHRRRRWVALVAIVALLAGLLALVPEGAREHLASGVAFKEKSAHNRLAQAQASIPVLREHFFFGVGLNQIRGYIEGTVVDSVVIDNTLHIQPLSILLDAGFFGFVTYMWLLAQYIFNVFRAALREPDPILRASLAMGVIAFGGIMTHLLVHPLTYFSVHAIVPGFVYAGWVISRRETVHVSVSRPVLPDSPETAPILGAPIS